MGDAEEHLPAASRDDGHQDVAGLRLDVGDEALSLLHVSAMQQPGHLQRSGTPSRVIIQSGLRASPSAGRYPSSTTRALGPQDGSDGGRY